MRNIKREIEDKYLLIEILSHDSLDLLNRVFNTHYSKKNLKRKMMIKLAPKDFNFYKKLMEQKPRGAKI